MKGKGDRGVIEGNILYYCLDNKPIAVNLSDGQLIWAADLTTPGTLEIFGEELLVEAIPDVYTLNKTTGQLQNRLQDIMIGYYDILPPQQIYGVLTVLDGKLYVGSSNGYFSRIDHK